MNNYNGPDDYNRPLWVKPSLGALVNVAVILAAIRFGGNCVDQQRDDLAQQQLFDEQFQRNIERGREQRLLREQTTPVPVPLISFDPPPN